MKLRGTLHTAMRALCRNPMRAMLTTLGIVIGIAAVIAMMEIGQGSSKAIQKSITSMGANNILIFPGVASSGGVSSGAGTTMNLTPEDFDAIVRDCTAIRCAAPIVRTRSQLVYANRNWIPQTVTGSTPSLLDVQDWKEMADGECFTDQDVSKANRVCVIGQTIARELFQGENPVGKFLRLKNVSFKVVGVLRAKGANMIGSDQDDIVIAPWTSIKARISSSSSSSGTVTISSSTGNNPSQVYPSGQPALYPDKSESQLADSMFTVRFSNIDSMLISARSAEEIPEAIKQITNVLRERHRRQAGMPDDFTIIDMTEISKMLTSTTTLMTNLLLCVAMISLVVGGVGIMNIMLVSVTERTREIGLRMAVGARSRDILWQFLVEAIVLCLIGGIMGIILGHGGSLLIESLLRWPIATSPTAMVAAVAVSATVGIVFGFYPAWKASRLDPIDALRYE